MVRQRLDLELVERGLARSRAQARDAVLRGRVTVDGETATKPAATVRAGADIRADDPAGRYVSRSALKLAAGLDAFGYDVEGIVGLDIGASTGGFTQVLLERGARKVFAVDVGQRQLDQGLRDDPRVVSLEGVNARDLSAHIIPEMPAGLVADVSFISLKLALPAALSLAAPKAWGVFLIKPQFEVGRDGVGKGGIVRDGAMARAAADGIRAWLGGLGWRCDGLIDSPIAGGDGNREFLIGVRRD